MFVDRRIKGMPITFVIVVVLMIVLTIFFGAWAVSAGAQTQDESFALAVTGGAPNLDRTNSGPSSGSSGSASSNLEGEGEASDEWWGKALLTACPFH